MALRDDFITEAQGWEGTPYHHCAMVKGVGCDCIGFIAGAAKAVSILPESFELPRYSYEWHLHQNEQQLLQGIIANGGVRVHRNAARPGDLLLFRYGRVVSHAGILLPEGRVIHARRDYGRVQIERLAGDLGNRLVTVYNLTGD